jgi:hypothetical protein
MSSRTVSVQAESEKKDPQGNALFEPLKGAYVRSSYTWPSNLVIHHFYIEGVDEMTRRKGGAGSIWFFVMPEGLTQSVIINLVDTKNKIHKKPLAIGLVLNPFAAQFDRYDIFQKP